MEIQGRCRGDVGEMWAHLAVEAADDEHAAVVGECDAADAPVALHLEQRRARVDVEDRDELARLRVGVRARVGARVGLRLRVRAQVG